MGIIDLAEDDIQNEQNIILDKFKEDYKNQFCSTIMNNLTVINGQIVVPVEVSAGGSLKIPLAYIENEKYESTQTQKEWLSVISQYKEDIEIEQECSDNEYESDDISVGEYENDIEL